ncbi:MAG: hypothetical protein KAH31_00385 [Candidatus Sabulitectum sp.]|nr:hypothetical protein [Candidatus Sabulitectum sp.]
MYSIQSGLILAFHGCDEAVVSEVVQGKSILNPSENDYDWLGNGIYFWEHNSLRAMEYAEQLSANPRGAKGKTLIKTPAVIGAVISLGRCLNLLESHSLHMVGKAYEALQIHSKRKDKALPQNTGGKDLKKRVLDCAVIETLHQMLDGESECYYDSVRGVFTEGEHLYPNAGFHKEDHIQICIRNPNCIKGFFLPRDLDNNHCKV